MASDCAVAAVTAADFGKKARLMKRYATAVFSDLEQHSTAWSRASRNEMVAYISTYRHLAESLASQYGCLHTNFTGDGHLFLFDSADAAVQFGLKLINAWQVRAMTVADLAAAPHTPLRIGCHFGECLQLDHGNAWIGRALNIAKRVEDAAEPDSVHVTESVLELVDLPLYRFDDAGSHALKGDHLPRRNIYRVTMLDQAVLTARPDEDLTPEVWFLKGVALIGTGGENSRQEEESYRQALRLRPRYAEAHNNLAILLRASGRVEEAAQHYREALRSRPDHPETHYNFAILKEATGDMAEASEHFRKALHLRSDYVDAHHSYANLLKARGDLAAA
ncbi:MAG TPA: tetratricopeptide repeat protein, partial [Kiloniellaceae bacterium]|nr:tetratricopeptide repeat protein [Kiloniellaceae bacterium]